MKVKHKDKTFIVLAWVYNPMMKGTVCVMHDSSGKVIQRPIDDVEIITLKNLKPAFN